VSVRFADRKPASVVVSVAALAALWALWFVVLDRVLFRPPSSAVA